MFGVGAAIGGGIWEGLAVVWRVSEDSFWANIILIVEMELEDDLSPAPPNWASFRKYFITNEIAKNESH